MNICVIGLGYIGFPTACLLAKAGHQVLGVDVNESVIQDLQQGKVHITDEEGLVDIAKSVLAKGTLKVATQPEKADVFIICVPTPLVSADDVRGKLHVVSEVAATQDSHMDFNVSGGTANTSTVDLTYIRAATESIIPYLEKGNLVILESTSPPGTTKDVVLSTIEKNGWSQDDVHVAHAPERVIPGAIIREMIQNDRVVGGITPAATQVAKDFYATLVEGNIFTTDATTAEFVKLIENTYRDVNIALANELAKVSEHLGIDVHESIQMANRHPRVNILNPGPGVGGHCIPVDPYFIVSRAPELTSLMQAARQVNDSMVDHVVQLAHQQGKRHNLKRLVILGAAYKADVADERNSPSVLIASKLTQHGYEVVIHDPFVEEYSAPLPQVLIDADALLFLTDHTEYKQIDPNVAAQHMAQKFVIDTRRCLDAVAWRKAGFIVKRLGDGRRETA